jgi:deoxyribodipyrimidine photolyase-related protein
MKAALVLATQLFDEHPAYSDPEIDLLVVIESVAAFRRRRYHAHKIVLLLSSMRHTVAELRYAGRDVVHHRLRDPEVSFSRALSKTIEERDITHLAWMRPTDDRVHRRLLSVAAARGVRTRTYPDALFLTPDRALDGWFAAHPARRMEDFYRWQRRRTGVLMHDGAPAGGRWNFDAENRHPLPRDKRTRALTIDIPPLPAPEPD